jgi:hypothetical protein
MHTHNSKQYIVVRVGVLSFWQLVRYMSSALCEPSFHTCLFSDSEPPCMHTNRYVQCWTQECSCRPSWWRTSTCCEDGTMRAGGFTELAGGTWSSTGATRMTPPVRPSSDRCVDRACSGRMFATGKHAMTEDREQARVFQVAPNVSRSPAAARGQAWPRTQTGSYIQVLDWQIRRESAPGAQTNVATALLFPDCW